MRQIESAGDLREMVQQTRCAGSSVGLVPTMGALHEGHLRLVDRARSENDLVVMSVFVNPTQFGPQEDFDRYPRDLARDRLLAEQRGVDILFAPDVDTMYPGGVAAQAVWVDPGSLAAHLDGAARPGHFRGVATVVTKLFNLVQPDRAYFGQKDGQQAVVVARIVRDLAFPIEIRVVPTVRENDGLALSSRNAYLSLDERAQATILYRALELARKQIDAGERDPNRLENSMVELISSVAPLARIDFVTVADLESLQPIRDKIDRDTLIALAVFFGSTRLIDNLIVRFVDGVPQMQ